MSELIESTYRPVESIIDSVSSSFIPIPELDAVNWLSKHFILDTKSSGVPGPLDCWPNQKAMAHCFDNDDIQFIGIQKCTRWGYTKLKCAAEIRAASEKKRKVIAYQPSEDERDGYYLDELQITLENSEYVRNFMMANGPNSKSSFNRKDRIAFKGGVLHNLGGKSPKSYRRRTADLVTLDEFDEFDQNIGSSAGKKQGSAIYTTNHGIRLIDNDPSTAQYMCEHCSALFDWQRMHEIDEDGEYRSGKYIKGDFKNSGLVLQDDGIFTSFSEKISDRKELEPPLRMGFKLNSMLSDFVEWQELAQERLDADSDAKKGHYEKLITFTNHVDGETWVHVDHEKIEPEKFEKDHTILYRAALPMGVRLITAGVDVSDYFIDVTFVGYGLDDIAWTIKHVQIKVINKDLSSKGLWDKVWDCLNQTFEHENGGKAKAERCLIDSGHSHKNVTAFCKRDPMRLICGKGLAAQQGQELFRWPANPKNGCFQIMTGGDAANEIIRTNYTKIHSNESDDIEPGTVFFPERDPQDPIQDRGFTKEYYKQLIADRRIVKRSRGNNVYSWEPPEGSRNDSADTMKLAFIAKEICFDVFGINIETRNISPSVSEGQSSVYDQISKLSGEVYGDG